ncbi:MAG: hypothetical protein JW709_02500, partial [Sedimentisphaerales bacterium]|nr:hypothetical protein [Sedimentisphaerales bacterium]
GYVFHEPWLAGKPLLGRNIPEITSDFVKSGLQISHLYDRLLIPLTWLTDEELKNLQREYYHKQQRFAAASNIEPPSRQLFIQTFEKTKIHPPTEKSTESGIDWADLSFELQLIILEKVIQNPSLLKHVVFLRCHPHQPCDWQNRPNAATIDANRRVVMNKYGLARHAQQLTRLYNLMGSLDISDAALSSRIDNQQLLINALQLERMHLLV